MRPTTPAQIFYPFFKHTALKLDMVPPAVRADHILRSGRIGATMAGWEASALDMASGNTVALGRPLRTVSVEIVRELTEADLSVLGSSERGMKPTAIKRLTDMHHSIARLIAQGERGNSIALATGYSISRISILKSDPAFQELVEYYREKVEDVRHEHFIDVNAKMTAVLVDTIESMHEDVLDGVLTPRDKVDYAKFMADRSGFGPASKSENLNMNLDLAGQLAVGRQRAIELSAAIPAAKAARELSLPSRAVGGDDE